MQNFNLYEYAVIRPLKFSVLSKAGVSETDGEFSFDLEFGVRPTTPIDATPERTGVI